MGGVNGTEKHMAAFEIYLKNARKDFLDIFQAVLKPSTTIRDYKLVSRIGQGTYGQVFLVQSQNSNSLKVLKIIEKNKLLNKGRSKRLLSEIKVSACLKFDFLASFDCYFTDKCRIFIASPYVENLHFFTFLKRVKQLKEDAAQFYAGQVVLALEYLHFMGVVYRDLKPENILIDKCGYLKLIDFGFAKRISNSYTYTVCGTPEFMAPEILLNKGYGMSIDWWSLGIFIYELCAGSPPFTSQNMQKVFEKILGGHITWPEHFSLRLKSLTGGLLKIDRTMRLGCMKNLSGDIKRHKWFSALDWTALWQKKLSPPLVSQMADIKITNEEIFLESCSVVNIPSELCNIDSYV